MKPRLVVSLPLVWSVRNVLRSGLADVLSRDFQLLFAAPPEGRDSLVAEGVAREDVCLLERPATPSRLQRWALHLLRTAHRQRHPTRTDAVFDQWNKRNGGAAPDLRDMALAMLGRSATAGPVFRGLQLKERDLFRAGISPGLLEWLQDRRPVLGLSTSCVVDWERPLFEALRMLDVPTATMLLSFDNLTSRGYLPLMSFDRYLVWQGRMAAEVREFYQVPDAQIAITGTPQFDFHVCKEFHWTREVTARALGLDLSGRYIVYCANHVALTPNEPELVAQVLLDVAGDPALAAHQWVVRLHPMDTYARWERLAARFDQVVVSHPWRQGDGSFWGAPSANDIALLGNTLRHADAAVTMASTTALDSAVVDTPIVCVGFHPATGSAEDRFYRAAHYTHHYLPITESGAAPVAHDLASLRGLLREAVTDPAARRLQRERLVEQLCGVVDGGSVARIAGELVGMLQRTVRITEHTSALHACASD